MNALAPRPSKGLRGASFVAAIVASVGCGHEREEIPQWSAPSASEQSVASVEELAVYAALLNSVFVHEGTGKLVVRSDRVVNAYAGPELVQQASLRTALQAAQAAAGPFPASVPTTVPLIVVSQEDLRASTANDWGEDWKPFFGVYPGAAGIITLSAVGLDPGLGMALVTYTFQCGSSCGGSGYYILKKSDGLWAVADGGQVANY